MFGPVMICMQASGAQTGVVGDEGFVGQRQLDDGVASGDDLDAGAVVHRRAHVAAHESDVAQRGEDIQLRQRVRQLQQLDAVRRHLRAQFAEQICCSISSRRSSALSTSDLIFLEIGRDVALAVGNRLLADVVGGHFGKLRLR
jgi:hypothetical protein